MEGMIYAEPAWVVAKSSLRAARQSGSLKELMGQFWDPTPPPILETSMIPCLEQSQLLEYSFGQKSRP